MHAPAKRRIASRQKPLHGAAAAILVAVLISFTAMAAAPGSTTARGSSEASLLFARGTARVVGTSALVLTRCAGPRTETCTGTVSLRVAGRRHQVPFSVTGRSNQSLLVPVGRLKRPRAASGLAVAKTLQSSGRYVRSREVLRFK